MVGNSSTRAFAIAFATIVFAGACGDDDNNNNNPGVTPDAAVDAAGDAGIAAACFQRTDLVSDQANVAARMDPELINAWGLVAGAGAFWIANAGSGVISIFDAGGTPAQISTNAMLQIGEGITGMAVNSSTAFTLTGPAGPVPATVIVARETGELIGVNLAVNNMRGVVVVDNMSASANYKGVAILQARDGMRLLAADFHNARVDVFDENFMPVTTPAFTAQGIPAGFAPFNVAVLNDAVYVAYAQQDAMAADEVRGAGLGFVSKFDDAGTLLWTATSPLFNAPWGMALPPATSTLSGTVLVGNFGDGRINALNADTGRVALQLTDRNTVPLAVDGLWGIEFGDGVTGANPDAIYFAAGPADEAHGLYGVLAPCP
jgi:uncharacterized protein (TIGR03118 family)